MTTGYGSLTMEETKNEVREMRRFHKELLKDPRRARDLLIRAGILDKSGKQLSKKYRS